jgi:serine/threonine protein kinase
LISGLLEVDPEKRLTVANVLSHPWVVPNSPISPTKNSALRKPIFEAEEFSSDEEIGGLRPFGRSLDSEYYMNDSAMDKIHTITFMHDYEGRERIQSQQDENILDESLSTLRLKRACTSCFMVRISGNGDADFSKDTELEKSPVISYDD